MSFAMIFPGQASQYVGMLADVSLKYPIIKKTFAEASVILNYDLWDLVQNGSAEELDETTVTQPAVFTASIALWRLWCELGGPVPDVMAGHSLGEYSALVAAGALSFIDGVRLVQTRAALMAAEGVKSPGKMLIILGLEADQVEGLCVNAADKYVLSVANYNSPQQFVVAGESAAIDRLAKLAQEAGAKRVMPAAVSVASHCALMSGSQPAMQKELSALSWHKLSIPVMQNASLKVPADNHELQKYLIAQLVSPVRWVEQIFCLQKMGADVFVECGPGKVLTGLMKRIDKNAQCYATDGDDLIAAAVAELELQQGDA